MSPFWVVVFRVRIPTEAKPCSLGRSGSAHPNERRSDLPVGNRGPHSLVGLAPGMVFFRLPHHHWTGAAEAGQRLSGAASSASQRRLLLHGSTPSWFRPPLPDQSLDSC